MGLSSKQVSSDHLDHFNWTQNIMLTTSADTPTIQPPPSTSNHRTSTPMKRSLQTTQQSDPLKCPRCDSTNTKFCYYNNYNKTQPRHFCKACKRHWTKGGTLRNVPVGGGRKNKRIKRPDNTTNTTVDHSLGFSDHQKYVFPADDKAGLFFKPNEFDQVSWDFNAITTTMQQSPPHQNLGHQNLLTSSSIDHTNPIPMIPTSFAPLLSDFKDDSTTSRMMIPNSSQLAYMQQLLPTTSNFLEPSYWPTTWNIDIDSMVLHADLNKPFDQDHK